MAAGLMSDFFLFNPLCSRINYIFFIIFFYFFSSFFFFSPLFSSLAVTICLLWIIQDPQEKQISEGCLTWISNLWISNPILHHWALLYTIPSYPYSLLYDYLSYSTCLSSCFFNFASQTNQVTSFALFILLFLPELRITEFLLLLHPILSAISIVLVMMKAQNDLLNNMLNC
jgi:hypothetical protein